jgi:hypothetical protein
MRLPRLPAGPQGARALPLAAAALCASIALSQDDLGFSFTNVAREASLGAATRVDRLEVRWPSGLREAWRDLPADQLLTLKEGSARQASSGISSTRSFTAGSPSTM